MKTIYLHIGRGKTGTTSIQSMMGQCIEHLKSLGVHYIQTDGGSAGHGHQAFAKSLITAMPAYMTPVPDAEMVQERTLQEMNASRFGTLVLSSENFPLADPAHIKAFLDQLQYPRTVKVILFARSQDELLESEYNQMVKLKNVSSSVMTYFETEFEGADFLREADRWANVFGEENLICEVFDGSKNNVVQQFLSCLGLPENAFNGVVASKTANDDNRSLGLKALTALRLLNEINLNNREHIYAQITRSFQNIDLPPLLLTTEQARWVRSRFSESNEQFSRKYLKKSGGSLSGRRYSDKDRDQIIAKIKAAGF